MLRSRIAAGILTLTVGTLAVAAARPLFQDMPMPTKNHATLQEGVGEWVGTLTMSYPDMPTDPIPATDSVKALGGFWTTSTFQCDFMGMPYTGKGQMGYDPEKKKYVGTWIDSMSSTLAVMEGEQKGDKIVMHWEAPDMTGKVVPHRSETVWGEDSYVMEFFAGEGEMEKNMEIKMKRKPVEAGAPK